MTTAEPDAVLGLLSARFSSSGRRWYVAGVSAGLALALVVGRSFTDLGHLVAWLLGLALAALVTCAQAAVPQVRGRTAVEISTSSPHRHHGRSSATTQSCR